MRRLIPVSIPLSSLLVALPALSLAAQNSTRKERAAPSPQAARIGSAVRWRANLAAAKDESQREGKPLFWYVPTVPGSPMDRKREIDRYMMGGPFSWPETVRILNERFVPVKATPKADEAKARGLVRQAFIEPGFVVVAADGQELARCDRLTTHAPDWWRSRLSAVLEQPVKSSQSPEIAAVLEAYGRDDLQEAIASCARLGAGDDAEVATQARFLAGVVLRRARRFAEADAAWDELVAQAPEHMLAFKVAAEREGHGPFLRAFEDFRPLPTAVLDARTSSSQAPEGVYTRAELMRRSVRFLLDQQGEDGLYRDSTYDFGGSDSLPNVHMAITALVGWALLEARPMLVGETTAVDAALRRIEACVGDESRIAAQDRDEIAWAHAYRLRLICRLMEQSVEDRSRLLGKAIELVGLLTDLQEDSGAWFHEYPNPFVMASVLLALHAAKTNGVVVPEDSAELGAEALRRCRAANGAFPYGFARRPPAKVDIVGAAGRMPLCELALLRWGRSDQDKLAAALAAAFAHHEVMAAVRKYDDHADRHGYGGFFFWYDMRARSEAIAALEDADLRRDYAAKQAAIVEGLAEIDGCFVDSHELGRCYGTAMALLCLLGK
ncbi:MAG: hypothetical protein R3F56_15595 [Planctomycetota bacterium]